MQRPLKVDDTLNVHRGEIDGSTVPEPILAGGRTTVRIVLVQVAVRL
jgi:hypothetical protein